MTEYNAWILQPTVEVPDLDDLYEMTFDGYCLSTDGCTVETDGTCEHGYPSWMLYLGYIQSKGDM